MFRNLDNTVFIINIISYQRGHPGVNAATRSENWVFRNLGGQKLMKLSS